MSSDNSAAVTAAKVENATITLCMQLFPPFSATSLRELLSACETLENACAELTRVPDERLSSRISRALDAVLTHMTSPALTLPYAADAALFRSICAYGSLGPTHDAGRISALIIARTGEGMGARVPPHALPAILALADAPDGKDLVRIAKPLALGIPKTLAASMKGRPHALEEAELSASALRCLAEVHEGISAEKDVQEAIGETLRMCRRDNTDCIRAELKLVNRLAKCAEKST